jgi:hypothetical protein
MRKSNDVNGCVILRLNKIDPLIFLFSNDSSPGFTSPFVLHLAKSQRPPPLRPARLHLDILWWTAGAETSEREVYRRATCARSSRLPSLPQASR